MSREHRPVPPSLDPIAAQLQRRRQAAWRLPPLKSGSRDPLDDLVRKPAPILWLCDHPAQPLVLVSGTPRSAVFAAIKAANTEGDARWTASGQGWVLSESHTAAVAAAAEAAGFRVKRRRRAGEGGRDG